MESLLMVNRVPAGFDATSYCLLRWTLGCLEGEGRQEYTFETTRLAAERDDGRAQMSSDSSGSEPVATTVRYTMMSLETSPLRSVRAVHLPASSRSSLYDLVCSTGRVRPVWYRTIDRIHLSHSVETACSTSASGAPSSM